MNVGVKGFSVVFDASNLSCHYSELLFLSLGVDYLERGSGGTPPGSFRLFSVSESRSNRGDKRTTNGGMVVLWEGGARGLSCGSSEIHLPSWCAGATLSPARTWNISRFKSSCTNYHYSKQSSLTTPPTPAPSPPSLDHQPTWICAVIKERAFRLGYIPPCSS